MASIEIEKKAEDDYVLQAVGAEELYGEDYIVEPETDPEKAGTTVVYVHTWPVIVVLFRPGYRWWRSPWRWWAHPIWWHPWAPIALSVYRNRWLRSARRKRYRRTTRRRSVKGQNMYKTQRKTAKRYGKSPTPAPTQKKPTQQKPKKKKPHQKAPTQKRVP